ncbi:hypothetical protein BBJ29_005633 [Phytophthora kernoviae]|uniref:PA14 domain-containing protein n=1 Tax=Phytophthora kernoviae TaxID=325452 RepID=A0A3F2RXK0_9STRA|nr:hypothetical protein BBJ29_005633 [Phytophthora kernoviae]RLN65702.1 hypothetical protein BBP00_00002703 [Phytophthora kernoviae]
MYTYPATASPTTTSLDLITPALPRSQADPPVVFIAGALIETRLTTRDSFGNVLETGGNYFQLDKAVRAFLNVPIVDEKNGSYLITLRPTRSMLFPFTPKLMMPGGVNASYYAANAVPDTADPAPKNSLLELQRHDPSINFDFGDRPPQYVQSAGTFSVRWEGFLLPQFSEIYTFEVEVMGLANLRVGSATAAVTAGDASVSVKVPLTAQTFVQLELNFSKPQDLPNAAVQLLWSSLSQAREVIPSSQLFTSWGIVNNVPLLDVKPALAEPTAFTAEFASAWLPTSETVQAVVDKPLIFITVVRDRFGNRLSGEDYCTLYVKLPQVPQGSTQPDLVITDLLDGSYKVLLTPHLTGIFSFLIAALPDAQKANAPAGGASLVSFLSTYNIKGSRFNLQVDPGLPSAAMTTLIGGGFVTATAGKRTAFALELRDGSSNLLTIAMVTSYLSQVQVKLKSISKGIEVPANASQVGEGDPDFFSGQEVRVEYTATLAGLYTVLLSVDGGTTFAQKTTTLNVFPNVATAATSLVSPNGVGAASTGGGLGPQISTNQGYTYHVTVRDTFGNTRTSGGDLVIVRINGPDNLIGTITDLSNGDYVVAYHVARPGPKTCPVLCVLSTL